MKAISLPAHVISLILTLLSLARDQIGVWTRQGAGLFTGETPQTARDLPFQGSQNLGSV